ncbi:GMC family oxidoreductase [Oceanobacillus sp. AG]|uniref:GMC family oxidoreductase n=1 Tax=Oceanobacillus sp. AG TaxID=2681969 RepID=UPI0012EB5591|nr:GMC family oxidoreductase [Oceanobacillus sp. AG]
MAIKLDKVDVVVVGTGWSGGIVSAELAKAGYKVVGLERGKEKTVNDYLGSKDELRFTQRYDMMQDLSKETITSRSEMDEEAQPVRTQAEMMVGNDVGGGSAHWAGCTFRNNPFDFEVYTKTVEKFGKDKIPEGMTLQDWGITYDEFEKYYDRFEKTAGTSGEEDPLGPPRSNPYPNPPLKSSPAINLFKEAAENLGYHPYMIPAGNMSEAYENPDGEKLSQCQFCSYCSHFGCDFGAKSDPVVTVIPTAQKTGNYELRPHSYARRVLHNGKKATGIMYVDMKTGLEYEQPADVVVLGGFTFTNTRLLLLSEIGKPYNPKKREGVIGRNFVGQFNNTFLGVRGFFNDKKFNMYGGAGALGATLRDFTVEHIDPEGKNFIHGGHPEIRQYGLGPIQSLAVPSDTPSWGAEFKDNSIKYANSMLHVWFVPGVMPWWHNYTDLDPTYKDAFGDPLLRVTNKLTDQDINIAKYGIEVTRKIMEEMGADIIDEDEVPEEFDHIYSGGHYAGGVAMGADPETSAVNNYLQMWDMENLFVTGGSAFPHFSDYHPTGTIGALAYRAAEGVEKYLKNGGLLAEKKTHTKKMA